jgi:uncharacterized membrane protein YbhN (UPF0104 family)
MPEQRTRTALWLLAGCATSGLFLWLAVRGVDAAAVMHSITGASVGLVSAALLALLAVYPVSAVRWARLAQGLGKPRASQALEWVVIGVAVNNTLPGRLGELARGYGLSRRLRAPPMRSIGTVIVDRLSDVLVLTVLLGTTSLLAPAPGWGRAIGVFGLVVAVSGMGLAVVAPRLGRKLPTRQEAEGRARRHLRTLLQGLDCVDGALGAARAVGLTVLAWALWAIGAWCVARSLGVTLSATEVGLATAVINLGVAVPSSPGFVGTYQWLGVSVLQLFDIGRADALAFSVLLHALWFIPTTIVGVALMLRVGFRRALPSRRPLEVEVAP